MKKEGKKEMNKKNKKVPETTDVQVDKKKEMYIIIIKRSKKIQKQNCIHLFWFSPRSKSSVLWLDLMVW